MTFIYTVMIILGILGMFGMAASLDGAMNRSYKDLIISFLFTLLLGLSCNTMGDYMDSYTYLQKANKSLTQEVTKAQHTAATTVIAYTKQTATVEELQAQLEESKERTIKLQVKLQEQAEGFKEERTLMDEKYSKAKSKLETIQEVMGE